MARACAIDRLSKPARRAFLNAAPGGIVSKVPCRALIDASGSGVIPVLVSTTVEDTLGIENIAVSELSSRRASQNTTLCNILCKVVSRIDHWASSHADTDGSIRWMCEVKHVLGFGAESNTAPCSVVSV